MSDDRWQRDPSAYSGRVETRPIESRVLRGNPLGDPATREVPVWLPPGAERGERFPVVFLLAGLTGRGHKYLETHPWKRGVITRYDRLVADGSAPPAILVAPDCFTALGGSQYLNSTAVGAYEDHFVDELVPFVDAHYPTLPGRRGLVGKSSGGFGALHLAMHHPRLFPVAASISGDCGFEQCYGPDLLVAARALGARWAGDPRRFLSEFAENHELKGDAHAVLNVLAMSACYSPAAGSELGFELPIDLQNGEIRADVFARWLALDPLRAAGEHEAALRSLRLLHIEAGVRDEFNLQFGARRLSRELTRLGIPHTHEEHEGGHFDIDERFLSIVPRLVAALSERDSHIPVTFGQNGDRSSVGILQAARDDDAPAARRDEPPSSRGSSSS